ncbi:hypothetical protein M758_3G025300 [Ceratodon purpureus]|nr:hypothetical protein M758_3G025300 [Ceratodon purpureus]
MYSEERKLFDYLMCCRILQGDYGPFRPQIPVTVPLWLGIAMKKRSKCRIQPPDWMSVERLSEVLEMEREAPREFQPLPFHYVEIAKLLLDNAREDFENNYMVQSLLEDIKDVRWDKVEKGLKNLSGRTHAVKVISLLLNIGMHVVSESQCSCLVLVNLLDHDHDNLAAGVVICFHLEVLLHQLLLDKLHEDILLTDSMEVVAVFS